MKKRGYFIWKDHGAEDLPRDPCGANRSLAVVETYREIQAGAAADPELIGATQGSMLSG